MLVRVPALHRVCELFEIAAAGVGSTITVAVTGVPAVQVPSFGVTVYLIVIALLDVFVSVPLIVYG
jgi:hypothetical protein